LDPDSTIPADGPLQEFPYIGTELEAFSHARGWKKHLHTLMAPYITGDVLEVGAGIGNNTALFSTTKHRSWTCLEPDAQLAARVPRADGREVIVSTIRAVSDRRFDSILYIDVLEHIEDDGEEMRMAAGVLRPGGHLAILVPAHQWLFSRMDEAIGHFRRYNRQMLLRAAEGSGLELVSLRYHDSVGMAASLANRLLLHEAQPKVGQIRFWDSYMVPVSKVVDPLMGYHVGKSLLGIWRKPR
jgi:SAM-dependent methyltransferase